MQTEIILSGDLDLYALPAVDQRFAELAGDHVVIDLHDVRLVSAAFIGALVRLRKRLGGARIDVVGASPNVRRTFSVVGATMLVNLA